MRQAWTCDLCGTPLDRGDALMVVVMIMAREFDEDGYRANGYLDAERFFSEHRVRKELRFCRSIHAARRLLEEPL